MSTDTVRTHIVISKELVAEVDRLVGPRRRSEFISEAVAQMVARERLRQAAHKVAGSLADVDTPGWETQESAVEWVRSLRRESDEKMLKDWKK